MRSDPAGGVRRAISLTPLIDVVFLLLLFFMLASTFERYSTLSVVTAQGTARAASRDKPILVRLRAETGIDVNGVRVDPGRLADHLRGLDAGTSGKVVVSVGDAVATQTMVEAIERIQQAGFGDVAVSR